VLFFFFQKLNFGDKEEEKIGASKKRFFSSFNLRSTKKQTFNW